MSVRTRLALWSGDLFGVANVLRSLHLLRDHPDVGLQVGKKSFADPYREIGRSKRLIADLLTYAPVDGSLATGRQWVDLDEILLEALTEARHRSRGQQIDASGVEPTLIQGDPDLLRLLFLILMDTALKHTPSSGRILASLRQSSGRVVGTIVFDGAGIQPEEFLWVYERFDWEDPIRPVPMPGIGPALAFAAWIAEQHGGELGFATTSEHGTRAAVCLPVNRLVGFSHREVQALSRWPSAPSWN